MDDRKVIFISHKNADLSNSVSAAIEMKLTAAGYKVFFDKISLKVGTNWRESILDALDKAEVLIVVMEPSTADSDWVQREVDMARGAKISILPILVTDSSSASDTIDRLALGDIQFEQWDVSRSLEDLPKTIGRMVVETYKNQHRWIRNWETRSHPHLKPEPRAKVASFRHRDTPGFTYYLAQGDATEINGYDVLVNTENTFMQMARAYELNTLSSSIRHRGAEMRGGLMIDDTIQDELFQQIEFSPNFNGLPLQLGQVIPTYAGHSESDLAHCDYRYIFHAAAVEIDRFSRQLIPPNPAAIPDVIREALRRAATIDRQNGAVKWIAPGELEPEKDDHEPIESILFPVFGAGQGGGSFEDAIKMLAQGFLNAAPRAIRDPDMHIREIGLCVYNPDQVQEVKTIFESLGYE